MDLVVISALFAGAAAALIFYNHHREISAAYARVSPFASEVPIPVEYPYSTIRRSDPPSPKTVKRRKLSETRYEENPHNHESMFGELKRVQGDTVKRVLIKDNSTTTEDLARGAARKGFTGEVLSAEQRRRNLKAVSALKDRQGMSHYNHDSFVQMRNRFFSSVNKPEVIVEFTKLDSPTKLKSKNSYELPKDVTPEVAEPSPDATSSSTKPQETKAPIMFQGLFDNKSNPLTAALGASKPSQPTSALGQPAMPASNLQPVAQSASMFGTQSAQSTSLFGGQPATNKQDSKPPTLSQPATQSLFGSKEPVGKASTDQPPASLFGNLSQAASAPPASESSGLGKAPLASGGLFGQPAANTLFGGQPAVPKPMSSVQAPSTIGMFGGQALSANPLFPGQTSSISPLFASQTPSTGSSLFGGQAPSTSPASAVQQPTQLFGQTPPAVPTLIKQNPVSDSNPMQVFGSTGLSASTKSVFGAPSQQTSMAQTPAASVTPTPQPTEPPKIIGSLFGNFSPSAPMSTQGLGGLSTAQPTFPATGSAPNPLFATVLKPTAGQPAVSSFSNPSLANPASSFTGWSTSQPIPSTLPITFGTPQPNTTVSGLTPTLPILGGTSK